MTATLSLLGAFAALWVVYRLWSVLPPATTLLRSLALSIPASALAALWPAPGFLLLIKLPAIALTLVLGFLVLGEFSVEELALAGSMLTGRPLSERNPGRA